MRFFALATDYDGTLAEHGHVDEATMDALKRLRKSGRKAILVTGRLLGDLEREFPNLEAFDKIVAENGGLLYDPRTKEETLLGAPANMHFVERLQRHVIRPLDVGRVIVATWEPHDAIVLRTIGELGLDLQVIFNKGAVMVLPANVNKATGLESALARLGLSPHNVVSIGDAENDLAFLGASEIGVAVANALESVKAAADMTMSGARGAGVCELIDRLLKNDLADVNDDQRGIEIGTSVCGPVRLRPYCGSVLLAGKSGSGKSSLVTGFVERLCRAGYQYCLVDPEGDFERLPDTVVLGNADRAPDASEVAQVLLAGQNLVVQLLAVEIRDRPVYFDAVSARLSEMRSASGRPHWIVIDEAHHLFPEDGSAGSLYGRHCLFFITTRPELIARRALEHVDVVVAVGAQAAATVTNGWRRAGVAAERFEIGPDLRDGEALLSYRALPNQAERVDVTPGSVRQRRHRRKYAHGDLADEKSFYFTGAESKLRLKAQNLSLFVQIASGIDEGTWSYHLRRGEYSQWIREALGDDALSESIARIESDASLNAEESRSRIKDEIERCYTASA